MHLMPHMHPDTIRCARQGPAYCECMHNHLQGAPHAHVAADLLSQAEHGPDSQVTTSSAPTCACNT